MPMRAYLLQPELGGQVITCAPALRLSREREGGHTLGPHDCDAHPSPKPLSLHSNGNKAIRHMLPRLASLHAVFRPPARPTDRPCATWRR